jgi:hypothetical protein
MTGMLFGKFGVVSTALVQLRLYRFARRSRRPGKAFSMHIPRASLNAFSVDMIFQG